MATRRRSRFSTLTNTVSDINQRLRYVEKRRSYSRLARQVVNRQNIKPKAVSTDQLANKSVTTEIIDDDAVTSAQIADGTIQSGNIGPGSIQNVNMGGGQVDGRVLADNSIESRHIKNGEVKTEDINPGAVTNDRLSGGITNDKLAGSITNDKLAGGITNEKLAGGITNEKLAGGITNEKLAGGITNEKLAGGITNAKLAGNITNDKLAGNITNDKLAGGITNGKLAGGITRDKISPQIISTVSAGNGLSGGGSANSVSLSVDFSSVARSGHNHTGTYATVNHGHDNFARSTHTHTVSGRTDSNGAEPNQFHSHFFGDTTSPSSLRFKKDISSYEFDLDKLLTVDLKRFRYLNQYKPHKTNRDWFYGYLAEEMIELGLEEVVCYDEKGEPNAINYGLVGVFALEIIKLQEKRINNLETIVEEMQKGLM